MTRGPKTADAVAGGTVTPLATDSTTPADAADAPYRGAGRTGADPGAIAGLLAAARELRPALVADQAATEDRGTYSEQTHRAFVDAGFYGMLRPRRFGGLEVGVPAFYVVVAEVARGCPSTAWGLCLASGHALQIGSFYSAQAQEEIFVPGGYFASAGSGNSRDAKVEPAEGGYRISGTWHYCSGSPHSSHFMGNAPFPPRAAGDEPSTMQFVVERKDFEVLDDWGGIVGMRGSGSNSVRIASAFVPERHTSPIRTWFDTSAGPTVGSLLHDNAVYAGAYAGFAEGEIAAVAVGLGRAALDEYQQIMMTSNVPRSPVRRADHVDFQRTFGEALGYVDAAEAILVRGGQLFEDYCEDSVTGSEPFTEERAVRLTGMYYLAEDMVWQATEGLLRAAGSRSSASDSRLLRYFRDILTTRTRTDNFSFEAAAAARHYLQRRSSA